MLLGREILAGLPVLRAQAESMMFDTCTVSSVVGHVEDDRGATTPVLTQVYAGRCRVQTWEPHERTPEVGGGEVTVQRYSVHVPVGAFEPRVGQQVVITAAELDPYLAGRTYRVTALLHKTAATAYRLAVEEVH